MLRLAVLSLFIIQNFKHTELISLILIKVEVCFPQHFKNEVLKVYT